MKKFSLSFIVLTITILFTGVVYSDNPLTATLTTPITVVNDTAATLTNQVVTSPISSRTLIDSGYIESDGLNMHLHEGGTDVPFMPGTDRLDVKYAFNNAGVNQTSQAQSTASSDINLPALDTEIFEIALDHAARILHLRIDTVAFATTYEISWEYYNGASWIAFGISNVTDNTDSFQIAGTNTVEFGITPDAWIKSTLHTDKTGYWIRAVAAISGLSQAPLGTQIWYDTGRFFFTVDSITTTEEKNYNLYTGGDDTEIFHLYFPGFDGITTLDDADLELDNQWAVQSKTKLNIDNSSGHTGNLVEKTSAFNLSFTAATTSGGNNTITLNAPSTSRYGEWTHNEEDGATYYSGIGIESHSKTFYNGASNYLTARNETSADVLSNTASEVTSHKIGQAYTTSDDTTPAFGDKIADPS